MQKSEETLPKLTKLMFDNKTIHLKEHKSKRFYVRRDNFIGKDWSGNRCHIIIAMMLI